MDATLIRSRLVPQIAAVCTFVTFTATARADIYQWEYIDPADPSQGKRQSTMLALDGAGVDAVPYAGLSFRDLTMAYLTGANLAGAHFYSSTLTTADLSGAVVTGAFFGDTTSRGFTKEQLYSTASYQERSLQRIGLAENDLTGWDFEGQNLDGAYLYESTLTNADLSGANLAGADLNRSTLTNADLSEAVVTGASFPDATTGGLTKEQLYSTASYQEKNLQGIRLGGNNLTGWCFAEQDLTGASLHYSMLTNADLTGAVVTAASFWDTTSRGFTKEQLYSTANYQEENLQGIGLGSNDLTGWDFVGQNLADADLHSSTLTNADLSGANLAGANLFFSRLMNADLSGANLTGAELNFSTLKNADLSTADTRGASGLNPAGAIAANTILPDGQIDGLELATGQSLVVRDYDGDSTSSDPVPPIPITVDKRFAMAVDSTLRMVFEDDDWDSTISFAPGIPVTIGGTLELTFADNVDLAGQLGRTLHLFDWASVSPTGAFGVLSPYAWDLASLYTTGDVKLMLTGDFNGNGQAEQTDLDLVLLNWGTEIADPAAVGWLIDPPSGIVNQAHLDKVLLNWGNAAAAGVPEPSTVLILATCVVYCLCLKNRRERRKRSSGSLCSQFVPVPRSFQRV